VAKDGFYSNVRLAESWLDHMSGNGNSPGYVHSSKYTLQRFVRFLGAEKVHVSDLDVFEHLDKFSSQIRNDPEIESFESFRKYLNIVVSWFKWLALNRKRSGVQSSSWSDIKLFRADQKAGKLRASQIDRRVLSPEEVRKLIQETRVLRDKAMLGVLWASGVRNGELAAMNIEDVRTFADHAEIRIEEHAKRNGNDLKLAFATAEVARLVEAWIRMLGQRSGPLFPSSTGKKLTRTDVNRIVRRCAMRAGLMDEPSAGPVSTHSMRHSYTTQLRATGCPDHIIARLRGDSEATRFAMVAHYTHLSEKELLDAYLKFFPTLGITTRT
jgi:integrase